MQISHKEERVLDDLIKTCKSYFGFNVLEATAVKQGWLNLKWKLNTDTGVYLIKQYNKERYKLYKREELLFAFSQQMLLHVKGVPCPKLHSYNGQFLLESKGNEIFMLMDYCNGSTIPPGTLNQHQMYDLGRVTGNMHQLLNNCTRVMRSPEFVPPSRHTRLSHWKTVWQHVNGSGEHYLLPIIEKQYKVTENINVKEFNLSETGFAHRDLWVDNLLFKEKKVSAILDFDRMKYDYPQLDVARAILSGALNENKLDLPRVLAFLEGYGESRLFNREQLFKSLELLWFMESKWWITPNMHQQSGPPERFAKEMIWLSENLEELESILWN